MENILIYFSKLFQCIRDQPFHGKSWADILVARRARPWTLCGGLARSTRREWAHGCGNPPLSYVGWWQHRKKARYKLLWREFQGF